MFTPEPLPQTDSLEDLRAYLDRTMQSLAQVINHQGIVRFDQQYTSPDKAGEVDFGYFAAGTVGVNAGFYAFINGVWVPAGGRALNAAYLYSTGNVQQVFSATPIWDDVAAINSKGIEVSSVADVITRTITVNETRAYLVMGAASISTDKNNASFTLGISVNGADPSVNTSMLARADRWVIRSICGAGRR